MYHARWIDLFSIIPYHNTLPCTILDVLMYLRLYHNTVPCTILGVLYLFSIIPYHNTPTMHHPRWNDLFPIIPQYCTMHHPRCIDLLFIFYRVTQRRREKLAESEGRSLPGKGRAGSGRGKGKRLAGESGAGRQASIGEAAKRLCIYFMNIG